MAQRRSAKEWGRVLRELEASNQTVAAFAKSRGIRVDTLKWWRWRLGKAKPALARVRARAPRVKLLAIEPARELAPSDPTPSGTPVWELLSPTGHALRVFDRDGLGVLKAALSAVARGRRRR